jgi:hypothetical protein
MSVAKTIADACVTLVAALSTPPAKTVLRKTDICLKADDKPCCVVTIQDDSPDGWATLGDGTTADRGAIGKSYTIGFSIYSVSNGQYQTDVDDLPQVVQDVQQLFGQPTLSAASTAWHTELIRHPMFEGQFEQGWEVSRFAVLFRSAESRIG